MMSVRNKKHIITLGGLPGSGKSTVGKILAKLLGYKTFSTGDFVRNMAAESGISLEELNDKAAHTRTIDEKIDAELIRIEENEDEYVIDSHLAFHFIPSGFSVFLDTPLEESAKRIFGDSDSPLRKKSGDTMKTLEEAVERTRRRIRNHKERYMEHYHIDPYIPSHYDLVVDTVGKDPEAIADFIYKAFLEWSKI